MADALRKPHTRGCCAWLQIITKAEKNPKMTPPYQIFRKLPDNKYVWIENIDQLQEARGRLEFLSTVSDADYVLFDPRERTVVVQPDKLVSP
jgi:hypothetical protein